MKNRTAIALLLFATVVAVAYQVRSAQRSAAAKPLTAYVPQDALLTIESPDFASLLQRWSNSAESKTWLASDNYAVFQNSRLFGRLGDAQTSFASAAGIPAGADLLKEVAGKESIFAWYDIGKLEFIYITRMPAAQANQGQLFQSRANFQRRHAGNADFYIRTSGTDYSTVAFAQVSTPSGDLFILATREDLIANALSLIAAPTPTNSVRQEPWFRDASAALPAQKPAPALHMVLNLDRIALDPHFRSYWIQRNTTWTRQFRAAASDLYLEPTRFREERVLIPKSPEPANSFDVASLAALAPPSTGVFRAIATQDPSVAITAIQEKLLGSITAAPADAQYAPDPDLKAPQTGSASDLETRIDAIPLVSTAASTDALAEFLRSANLDGVLTLCSAQSPLEKDGLWVPIHSAVILHAANSANPRILASALRRALGGSLTAANIGIDFHPSDDAGTTIYAVTGPRPLLFATSSTTAHGNLILLSDDRSTLLELLHNLGNNSSEANSTPASLVAVFNPTSERAPYIRLTSLIDGTNNQTSNNQTSNSATDAATGPNGSVAVTSAPTFFSRNIGSLSDTFSTLQSERVVERIVDSNIRQTVTYSWQIP
ncbi:MAG: hypothetical protein M3O31_13880 [Acidobacteriota bacterium]|nr:hypothetical protein [Acidobacteriota bacterium]